jgi:hypothetical protein
LWAVNLSYRIYLHHLSCAAVFATVNGCMMTVTCFFVVTCFSTLSTSAAYNQSHHLLALLCPFLCPVLAILRAVKANVHALFHHRSRPLEVVCMHLVVLHLHSY